MCSKIPTGALAASLNEVHPSCSKSHNQSVVPGSRRSTMVLCHALVRDFGNYHSEGMTYPLGNRGINCSVLWGHGRGCQDSYGLKSEGDDDLGELHFDVDNPD